MISTLGFGWLGCFPPIVGYMLGLPTPFSFSLVNGKKLLSFLSKTSLKLSSSLVYPYLSTVGAS
ncbi:hypothetical protein Fmac_026777 [Flemingia macrophylla]|uniref:Uncharacterized protein n=1 Tax=Flemingia macrophylla TaxID=520843 RepID=A0ABD1LGD1_9FABA